MFTNFARSLGKIVAVEPHSSLVEIGIQIHQSLCSQLGEGRYVVIDGVKLMISRYSGDVIYCQLDADAMLSTLSNITINSCVNVVLIDMAASLEESRSITGKIDFQSCIQSMVRDGQQLNMDLSIPTEFAWLHDLGVGACLAINGLKGTICHVNHTEQTVTASIAITSSHHHVLDMKFVGDHVNIEIERLSSRALQAVDNGLSDVLGDLYPTFQQLLKLQGLSLESLAYRAKVKLHQEVDDAHTKPDPVMIATADV